MHTHLRQTKKSSLTPNLFGFAIFLDFSICGVINIFMEDVHVTSPNFNDFICDVQTYNKKKKKIQIFVTNTTPIPSREVKKASFIRAFGTHEMYIFVTSLDETKVTLTPKTRTYSIY